jgi:hypothetical protein
VLLQKLIVAQIIKFPTFYRIRRFFHRLFNDTFSVRTIWDQMGESSMDDNGFKDLEGRGHDLIEALSQHLPGMTEENYEKLSR